MRYLAISGYWISALVLLAAVLASFDYGLARALFVASSMLPGLLCGQFFLPRAIATPRRRGVATLCVGAGALVVVWVGMLLASFCSRTAVGPGCGFPPLFSNPIFLLVLLVAFVVPAELLSRWLRRRLPASRSVTFVSERRRVTLPFEVIVYVESNDSEVSLHAADGTVYRTRTRISQWERLLDDGFVRIHRAYIVNRDRVTDVRGQTVVLGDVRLELSRKYREGALARLRGRGANSVAGGTLL